MPTHLAEWKAGYPIAELIELTRASSATKPCITRANPVGTRVAILQPHSDDAALSVGGVLSSHHLDPVIVTSHSICENPDLTHTRQREDLEFALGLGLELTSLHFVETIGRFNAASPKAEENGEASLSAEFSILVRDRAILAPASVGAHPDHLLVTKAAAELGCFAFWEDVAFWGIYGLSTDDRIEFSISDRLPFDLKNYVLCGIDITDSIQAKAALLSCYPSQSDQIWRPIRHAANAALELRAPYKFCERLFVREDQLPTLARLFGGKIVAGGELLYGLARLRTGWIRPS